MTLGKRTREQIQQTARALIKHVRQWAGAGSHGDDGQPCVVAVTNRYPTRIVLYTAAFQGGWKVRFVRSLRAVVEAAHVCKPKAVFYDATFGDRTWSKCCSTLASAGIPFVFLAQNYDDETFLKVLASGGYQACGDPLASEEVVKAVDLAAEVAELARIAVT